MKTLFKNGKVVDVISKTVAAADILVEDDMIAAVGTNLETPKNIKTVDLKGMTVLPGLFNCHVHMCSAAGTGARETLSDASLTVRALKNLKTLVDADTVIGNPITTPDGTMIIPVSKVSFGFATGGSDLASKSPKDVFGGGSGGGVTIQPLCFLVVKNGDVKILHINSNNSTGSQALNMIPDVIDKISGIVKKDKPAEAPTETI